MIYILDWRENLPAGDRSGLANGPDDHPVYGAHVPQYSYNYYIDTYVIDVRESCQ